MPSVLQLRSHPVPGTLLVNGYALVTKLICFQGLLLSVSGSMSNQLFPSMAHVRILTKPTARAFSSCANANRTHCRLTAQLPYETGSPWSNIMSFFLAVGSPALVTYSLTITIMNRAWARGVFKGLRKKTRFLRPDIGSRYDIQIKAARRLMQEGQQVPLRASQEQGWLSSLIVLSNNLPWWRKLDDRLKNTRRGVTASLVAQTLFAAVAFLFTVIASFDNELGDPVS